MFGTHLTFVGGDELFSVKCNTVVLRVQANCVCPLARWTQILITRTTVVFSVTLTSRALSHVDLRADAYRRHFVEIKP